MQVERLIALARDTPDDALGQALGEGVSVVTALKAGKRPMTLREVGALAEANGQTLASLLSI
ncbi:hypothetical protein J2T10_001950 [Paenarthrobacter nicotinovorans]|uniref:HTH cro/C1-type domain-containing protein n=1 Tax=Paenarthrobacter nicotinovorans TaxID=29320 RepID=A0ABT9TKX8_PAENI|nr:hypothetical protein [Paenarthrobacter nicotinovorans]